MIFLILFIIGWLICSFICYGLMFGRFQNKFKIIAKENYKRDMFLMIVTSLFGYISLLSCIIFQLANDGKINEYGFKIK
jgi:hypothetical protein